MTAVVTVIDSSSEPKPAPHWRADGSVVMEFVRAEMRADPNLTFPALQEKAAAKGLTVLAVQYGRAKKQLARHGLDAAPAAPDARPPAEHEIQPRLQRPTRRSHPAKRARRSASGTVDLDALVASIRATEAERDRLRTALDRICNIIKGLE